MAALQPTGEFETLHGRHAWCWRWASTPTAASCAMIPEIESVATTRSWSTPSMMTGRPGIFAGGDMIGGQRTMTAGDRPRQEGGARTSTPGCAARPMQRRRQAPDRSRFETLNLPIFLDAERPQASELPLRSAAGFAEVVAGLEREAGALRGASAACPAATASNATIASPPARSRRS